MNRIREFRESIGMQQKELAAAIGFSPGAVSGWENAKFPPDYNALKKMSELFGKSIDEILNESGDSPQPNLKKNSKPEIQRSEKGRQPLNLSDEAIQLAHKYMLLNPSAQAVLRTVAEYELRQETYMRTEIEGTKREYEKQLDELRQQIPEVQDMTKEA